MTARVARTPSSLLAVVLVVGVATSCTNYFEIPIETPIRPKLDTSGFQRVLVAGFLSGGSEDLDGNLETTRLLRSQLRTKSDLRVIDTDVLPLMEVAAEGTDATTQAASKAPIKEQKDLESFEHLFGKVDYWKQIGEEYQQPLIVTGTVMFTPRQSNRMVQRDEEVFDSFGRRVVRPVRTFQEQKGFALQGRFVFIDGRTGTTLHSQNFGEQVLYSAQQATPALSSYFELMDRLIPTFLSTLSSQKIKGTRVLLQ
jgi:hypothetical protein